MYNMRVQKRDNNFEEVSFDNILNRIKILCISESFDKKLNIDPTIIAQKVCSEIYNDVKTSELDKLSSEISIALLTTHPDYAILSSRVCISNHQKGCPKFFSDCIDILYNNHINDKHAPIDNTVKIIILYLFYIFNIIAIIKGTERAYPV